MLSVYTHGLKVPNSLSNVVILWNLKSNNWFLIALGDCIQTPPYMSQVLFCTAWLESQLSRGYAVVKSYLSWTGITRSCKAYVSKWLENSSSTSRNWKGRSGLEISPACLRPSFLYRAQKCCSSIFFPFFLFPDMQLLSRNLTWIVHLRIMAASFLSSKFLIWKHF